jgi:hypothetical protein
MGLASIVWFLLYNYFILNYIYKIKKKEEELLLKLRRKKKEYSLKEVIDVKLNFN